MDRLSLKAKLRLALFITWAGLLFLGGGAALHSRDTMIAERKAAIRNVVEAASGIVALAYSVPGGVGSAPRIRYIKATKTRTKQATGTGK